MKGFTKQVYCAMPADNKLVLIGNGFDLAHGLKTSYKNFLDWYMCGVYEKFKKEYEYNDSLIEIKKIHHSQIPESVHDYTTIEEVLAVFSFIKIIKLEYKSAFFLRLINSFKAKKWVDIEYEYFKLLKGVFFNVNTHNKAEEIVKLNKEFDFIIEKLSEYIETVNSEIIKTSKWDLYNAGNNISEAFPTSLITSNIKYVNFNYTETLSAKGYTNEKDVIHIHGRAADAIANPIIFGYGDEADPAYQNIEDSGENMYLEHIKSFGYFKTNNYTELLSYIDSAPYIVYIVGHSCGLSDRVLLSQIFEHNNCEKIEIFYYQRQDGTDNFTEITQEISRHFKPQNKGLMRRRLIPKSDRNIIPQN